MVLWGCPPPPGGTSQFSPSLWRSTASKGGFLSPLLVPWLAQVNIPYTSPTRGRASSPRGSGTMPQCRSKGRAPHAPRAGSPWGPLCLRRSGRAPPPPRRGHPRRLRRRRRALGGWCWGRGGWGGMSSPPPAPLPSTRPPPGLPCPVPPVPRGPWRTCPCPWAPFRPPRLCPPARAVGSAACHPRPGLPAHPPSLAPLIAPGRPARAPARPSCALAPSRLPALCRAVCCPRSVPLCCCWPQCPVRVCALAPCLVCPGPLPARAPGHFPCRLLSPAPRSRGWHAAPLARRPLLPGSRAERPAAFAAAAA